MAIIKRYDSNHIYIPEKMKKILPNLLKFPVSIVEAPTGYGKTTIIKEFLMNTGSEFIWFNIDSTDRKKFFDDFSKRIMGINEECANTLRLTGFPCDNEAVVTIANALMKMEFLENTVLVLDNYQLIENEFINAVITDCASKKNKHLKIVCLTQVIAIQDTVNLFLKKDINYISKQDFEFSQSDISEYYRQCGIKLEESEAEFLYQYTEGWVSALYLQMLSFASTNSFESTANIDNLVHKAIWNNLSEKEQDFLIYMSIFPEFTIRQAVVITKNIINEDEIESLIKSNGFIKYDTKDGKYRIHSILKYFLQNEFEKMEPVFKKNIYKIAADWYGQNGDFIKAVTYYEKINDYTSVFQLESICSSTFFSAITRENKDLFLNIIDNTPADTKEKYIDKYMIFVYTLFVYNERDYLKNQCEFIKEVLDKNTAFSDRSCNELLGEYYFLHSFTHFNNISKMHEDIKSAYSLLGHPTILFKKQRISDFCPPSLLGLFHTESGRLDDELKEIDEFMPDFYKITDGKAKGLEALMRAEVLMNRGNFTDSSILCEKAVYMADSRNQTSIYLNALLLEIRIAIIKSDHDLVNSLLLNMKNIVEEKRLFELNTILDLSKGFVAALLEDKNGFPNWLTDYNSIENNCNIFNLGYANIIYGKYLIINGQYNTLLGISGQMLGIAGIFNNILYKIYTYIYIAIARFNIMDYEKSEKILSEAISAAYKDGIVLPFVETYDYIEIILDKLLKHCSEYSEFIEIIKNVSKKYLKSLSTVKKMTLNENNYGLTKRELDVARLAAKRMTNKEIAEMLFIAESTVKSNLKIIFSKLEINSRSELKNFF